MSFAEVLVNQSSLTKRQLESLLSYLRVVSGEIKLKEAASRTSKGAVTVGSYYRTVGQARKNLRNAIVTMLIGLWSGAVKPEDVRRLLDLAGAAPLRLTGDERQRFVGVLESLLDRMIL